jgi:hypothetical protein
MSPTWYTWLEQGRDVRPSRQVTNSLADALRLSDAERAHFYALARNEPLSVKTTAAGVIPLVDGLECPAYVRDNVWNLLHWNHAAAAFFGAFGQAGSEHPNFLRYLFSNPQAREVFNDWEEVAARAVGQFRRHAGLTGDSFDAGELADTLRAESTEFAKLWDEFSVQGFFVGECILCSGEIHVTFTYATLAHPDGAPPWVTLYTPLTDEDREKVNQVCAREPHLGTVGD